MKEVSIFRALKLAFNSLKINIDILKKVYLLELLFSFALVFVGWLMDQMNFLGKLFTFFIWLILIIMYVALILAFEWNVIYRAIKGKSYKLKQPFFWKCLGKYFIVNLLMGLLILFTILLPFFVIFAALSYLLTKLFNNLLLSVLSFIIVFTLFNLYLSVRFFFVKYIIATKIIKNKEIRYWQTIKESFSLSRGYFWKILFLTIIISCIALFIGSIPWLISVLFQLTLYEGNSLIGGIVDSLFSPIITIITQVLSLISALELFKQIARKEKSSTKRTK